MLLRTANQMSNPSSSFADNRQSAAPIDLAKFLLRRYMDPGCSLDLETRRETGARRERARANLFFTDRETK